MFGFGESKKDFFCPETIILISTYDSNIIIALENAQALKLSILTSP